MRTNLNEATVVGSDCRQAFRRRHFVADVSSYRAFTLIEIMVAVGIIAIIMAIGIPAIFRSMHKDSMRQAVSDVQEACREARARAVLDGHTAAVRISPAERTITVVAGATPVDENAGFGEEPMPEGRVGRGGGGGTVFSAKFSDHMVIEFLEVNREANGEMNEATCYFYPNGTSDELTLLLRSDLGEIRKVYTEIVTGISDVEIVR